MNPAFSNMENRGMNLALDYDDTYTRDPIFWDAVIDLAQKRGHKVYCITARHDTPINHNEVHRDLGKLIGTDACLFTSMMAKKKYAYSKGINIDVWIDDMPVFVDTGLKDENDFTSLWI